MINEEDYEKAYIDGRRSGLYFAQIVCEQIIPGWAFHTGSDGLIERIRKSEQVLIREGEKEVIDEENDD